MDILQKIIEMDREAIKRVAEANAKERMLSEEYDDSWTKAHEEAIERESRIIDDYCREQTEKLNDKLNNADKIAEEACRKLDAVLAAHKDEWKAEIIGRITEG